MKILVTGGSGFIGSHLVDKLIEKKHEVIVLDLKRPTNNKAKWVKVDILDLNVLIKTLKQLNVDIVYHLAAIADANIAYKNPILAVKVNIEGTANVLEACRQSNVSRVIYASTIWVYNASLEEKVDEDVLLTTETKHIYTTTKLFGEFLCHDYKYLYGLDYTILRFGIPYGPRGRFNVVSIFIKRALMNQPLIIRGSGEQKRQFIYVEDLALGCVKALKRVAVNKTYNLVGPKMISVNEIVQIIKKYIPNIKVMRTAERKGELGYKYVSSKKAETELNWRPKVDIDEGIRRTIRWYRAKMKEE